jgi:glycosyltransferase involved in cell wall biosynthesis
MPSRAESLPYVALEAAAAGKPIIATKVGGFPEIFGPSSEALVPPDDAVALAQTIAKTLDDPTAADRAAQVLRQRVAAAFSRDSMVDAVLASYEQTLEPRTRLAPAQSWLGSSLERDTSTTSLP